MKQAEEQLKSALLRGGEDEVRYAFGEFYSATVRLVYFELNQRFGRNDGIDDDVMHAFLSLYAMRNRLKQIKNITNYVIKSAVYICGRRLEKERDLCVWKESEEWEDEKENIPLICQEARAFEGIRRVLPNTDADIVIMKAAYGYSEKDIARYLGISEDAISYRYRKGMRRVKGKLQEKVPSLK